MRITFRLSLLLAIAVALVKLEKEFDAMLEGVMQGI